MCSLALLDISPLQTTRLSRADLSSVPLHSLLHPYAKHLDGVDLLLHPHIRDGALIEGASQHGPLAPHGEAVVGQQRRVHDLSEAKTASL